MSAITGSLTVDGLGSQVVDLLNARSYSAPWAAVAGAVRWLWAPNHDLAWLAKKTTPEVFVQPNFEEGVSFLNGDSCSAPLLKVVVVVTHKLKLIGPATSEDMEIRVDQTEVSSLFTLSQEVGEHLNSIFTDVTPSPYVNVERLINEKIFLSSWIVAGGS